MSKGVRFDTNVAQGSIGIDVLSPDLGYRNNFQNVVVGKVLDGGTLDTVQNIGK
jgi:hypothetical protein